jgi:hypothetical protein
MTLGLGIGLRFPIHLLARIKLVRADRVVQRFRIQSLSQRVSSIEWEIVYC